MSKMLVYALLIVALMWTIALAALVYLSETHGDTSLIASSITTLLAVIVGLLGGLGFHAVTPSNGKGDK